MKLKNLNTKLSKLTKNKKTTFIQTGLDCEDDFKPKSRRGRPRKKSETQLEYEDMEGHILEDELEALQKIKERTVDINKKENKQKYYVDTKRLEFLIKEYYSKEVIVDELAVALYNIAFRISFMPNFINYCVDKETEALTKRGWLKYNEITTSDEILSYNIETKRLIWSKINDLYINKYQGKMHSLNIRGMDALVTPNHKFVTLENGLTPVEYLKSDDHIILIGQPPTDNKKIYNDDFVELMGWAVTEGNYLLGKTTHSVQIFQKQGPKADRIQSCLNRLNIKNKTYNWTNPEILGFRFTKEYANLIVQLAPKKVLSMEFILNLTQSQRLLLIQTMLDGDGWTNVEPEGHVTRGYTQKDKNHIDTFVALCTLAGLTTKTSYIINKSKFGKGSYYYNVNIYNNPKQTCLVENIDFNGGKPKAGGDQKSLGKGKINRPNIPTVDYNDNIWCPRTDYGTFVCRRGKYIYITGNTWKEEMIGDGLIKELMALRNKKFNPDKGKAFSYFSMIVYNAFCNRIKKENKINEVIKDYQNEQYDKLMVEQGGNIAESHDGDMIDD